MKQIDKEALIKETEIIPTKGREKERDQNETEEWSNREGWPKIEDKVTNGVLPLSRL